MNLHELETVVQDRRGADLEASYTARLLGDPELTQRKIMEEAFEVCLELARPQIDKRLAAQEAADLLYHLLVGLVGAEVPLDHVMTVLEGRRK